MEKKKELSKSKEIPVIDLIANDENAHSSIKKCPLQTKKKKLCANQVSLQHVKKVKHNWQKNTLKDIVKKIKTKKVPSVPVSKTVQDKSDNIITIVDLSSNDSDTEDNEIQVLPTTPIVNSSIKDVTTLYSKSKHDPSTRYGQITEDNANTLSKNVNQYLKESFNISSKDLSNIEKEVLNTTEILKEDTIHFSQLNVNESETQSENIKVSENDIDISTLITINSSGEAVCHFYWWDAYENIYKQHGVVYLFGKVYINSLKTYYSCCLSVKHTSRRIYLLPKKYFKDPSNADARLNTMEDVHNEFNKLANKLGIKEYQSRRVWKKYVFEKNIPNYTEYLEISYPVIYPAIDSKYTGHAIHKVFETTISPMQLLLLERDIKGPCWLDIKCPLKDLCDVNWCKVKLVCTKIENISVSTDSSKLPLPPMAIATLNVRTCLDTKTKQNQIIMVTLLLQDELYIDKDMPKPPFKLSYCLVTKPNGTPWPPEVKQLLSNISYTNVIKCENESDLLKQLLQIIEKNDPDLYISYDCHYQFDTLLYRMFTLQIEDWSKIGKLKISKYPAMRQKAFVDQAISGRPICDIKILAKELNIRNKEYDLKSLRTTILKNTNNEYTEVHPQECSLYYITEEKVEDLIKLTFTDTLDILLITFELNIIPFAVELTRIAGHILSRTLVGGQIGRNEFLLLHAFHSKNYILPDHEKILTDMKCVNFNKKISNYEGGLVLNPQKGFYTDLILLMDYISLYPSIIVEYNLCFSTIPGAAYSDYKDLKIPESNVALGIIPEEIYKLTKYRATVKELMESPHMSSSEKMRYNVKQIALKLMANSLYGCLGAPHCRFYAKGLAALITSKGREILLNTKHLVENMKYKIIYGDTDSIMIKTNVLEYTDAISIGNKIKQEVNKLYKNIELNIDGVFQRLLLLKKKKYAAVVMKKLPSGQIELSQVHKGIETVRKDWCPLAVEVGKDILNNIFSNEPHDTKIGTIYTILQNVSRSIKENQISLSLLVISKQLSKNVEDYSDKEQPHVQVAKRLNRRGGKIFRAGDIISYVMCKSEANRKILNGAYHIDEIKENNFLKIDINYYLKRQIFPAVLRICEPIAELDKTLLAKNLGLDNVYKPKEIVCPSDNIKKQVLTTTDRFKHCNPIKFRCINENCKSEITITSITSVFHEDNQFFLNTVCLNESCKTPLWKNKNVIYNELQLGIRQAITMYYSNQVKCKNPQCSNIITRLPLGFYTTYPRCNKCKEFFMCRKYTETNLYDQICFYHHIFDISHPQYQLLLTNCSEEVISVYNTLKDVVDKYLRCTSYLIVNLNETFKNKFLTCAKYDKKLNVSPHEYAHMDDE